MTLEMVAESEFLTAEYDPAHSSPGWLAFASCRSGSVIARRTREMYDQRLEEVDQERDLPFLQEIDFRFEDQETCARLDQSVRGADVYLFQALVDPDSERSVDENLMALLIAARTLREWGARRVTAVLPYLAYARQEKPSRGQREPVTARLIADLIASAGLQQVITWDPHGAEIQGFFGLPVVRLSALELFARAFADFRGREDTILVAPDAGAAGRVLQLSQRLQLPSGVASKQRPQPGEAVVSTISGDFHGRQTAIIVDDMISSGGTVAAVIDLLVEDLGIQSVHLGVSHLLGRQAALERLQEYRNRGLLETMIVTDSVPQAVARQQLPFLKVHSLAARFAPLINRLHFGLPLAN